MTTSVKSKFIRIDCHIFLKGYGYVFILRVHPSGTAHATINAYYRCYSYIWTETIWIPTSYYIIILPLDNMQIMIIIVRVKMIL